MKKKLPFVQWFIKKNNVNPRPYVTEGGERLPLLTLQGNNPRLVSTTNRRDREFLGDNVISGQAARGEQ